MSRVRSAGRRAAAVLGLATFSTLLGGPVSSCWAQSREAADGESQAGRGDGGSATREAERAAELVGKGIALRKAGEDARALEMFEAAEELDPTSSRVLVHLAANHQALGEWADADRYLSKALADPEDPYIKKHAATLAVARRAIGAHMSTLRVSGQPAGATVRLNGRLLGELPLAEPVRVEAGIYTLEVAHPGHYPMTRSVALAGGALVRETVELSVREPSPPLPVAEAVAFEEEESSRSVSWVTWSLMGLGAVSTGAAVFAWTEREREVDIWNDESECLSDALTREQVCGDHRRAGERAERWGLIAGSAAGAFFVSALVNHTLFESSSRAKSAGVACGLGPLQVSCRGHF